MYSSLVDTRSMCWSRAVVCLFPGCGMVLSFQIPHVDMLGPLLSSVEEHLGVSAQRLPRGSKGRKNKLSKEYFRRIEAVDFTIK